MSTYTNTTSAFSTAQDEAEIRRLIEAWSAAVSARDLDGIAANYQPDTLLFDAIPPYKTIGRDAIRQAWANCLPFFPEQFRLERRDLTIQVAGDTAFAHFLIHFLPVPADDPCGQTWMRVTSGFRRIQGAWKVLHEHVSVPFNPMNSQVWFIRNPDVVDIPDYGNACT
ncbi:hypothetical protein LBMAG53_35290 [Planctomycetota bacterium]|nr:hypothetical protein LBMAG53_35290 [Planctomycetota bacterium]